MNKKLFYWILPALLLTGRFALGAEESGSAKLKSTAYYFPNPKLCTVMVDYQTSAQAVLSATGEARTQLLIKNLLDEFGVNGDQKCKTSPKVRLLAVLISGMDSYGRPDFGSRTNLLRLEGDADKFRTLIKNRKTASATTIRNQVMLEVYGK